MQLYHDVIYQKTFISLARCVVMHLWCRSLKGFPYGRLFLLVPLYKNVYHGHF